MIKEDTCIMSALQSDPHLMFINSRFFLLMLIFSDRKSVSKLTVKFSHVFFSSI